MIVAEGGEIHGRMQEDKRTSRKEGVKPAAQLQHQQQDEVSRGERPGAETAEEEVTEGRG